MLVNDRAYEASHIVAVAGSLPVRIISAETVVGGAALPAPVYILRNTQSVTYGGSYTGQKPYDDSDALAIENTVSTNGQATLLPGETYEIYASAAIRNSPNASLGEIYGIRLTTETGSRRQSLYVREAGFICPNDPKTGNVGCGKSPAEAQALADRVNGMS